MDYKKQFSFIYYIRRYIKELIKCLIYLSLFSCSNLMYPYFLKLIIDDALMNKSIKSLLIYSVCMLFTILIMLISKYLLSISSLTLCQNVVLNIKDTITTSLKKYTVTFFRQYKSGEIVSILENDLQQIQKNLTYMISELPSALITVIGYLVIICTVSYHIAISCILILIIYVYMQKTYGEKIKAKSLQLSHKLYNLFSKDHLVNIVY